GVPGIGEKTAARLIAQFGELAAIQSAAADPASKLTTTQRKRLTDASAYLAVAPKVVRVAQAVALPDVDPALPRPPRDPAGLRELAARWGLGGSLQRLLDALAQVHRAD